MRLEVCDFSALSHGHLSRNKITDLDTIASSVAYAWFASVTTGHPHVPLIQTPRGDLKLRPENIFACFLASLTAERQELLCIDDLPHYSSSEPFPSDKFALVDHNRLVQIFTDSTPSASVVAVIDHHEDEGLYKDTAEPRIIQVPTGSCTSLVSLHILNSAGPEFKIPSDLATLLLCGISIDTDGLKDGGKGVQSDHDAAAYLIPRTSLALSGAFEFSTLIEGKINSSAPVRYLASELRDKKSEVEHLTTLELLRRDYKQYTIPSHWTSNHTIVNVGLASCPTSLTSWIARDGAAFWKDVDSFMDLCGLNILGILTNSTVVVQNKGKKRFSLPSSIAEVAWSENKKAKKQKQKRERRKEKERRRREKKGTKIKVREAFFVVRELAEGGLEKRLWAGIESPEYGFKQRHTAKVGGRKARTYVQCGAKQSRKTIAPLVRHAIEGS